MVAQLEGSSAKRQGGEAASAVGRDVETRSPRGERRSHTAVESAHTGWEWGGGRGYPFTLAVFSMKVKPTVSTSGIHPRVTSSLFPDCEVLGQT